MVLGELRGPMREETEQWLNRICMDSARSTPTAAEAHNRLMLTKAVRQIRASQAPHSPTDRFRMTRLLQHCCRAHRGRSTDFGAIPDEADPLIIPSHPGGVRFSSGASCSRRCRSCSASKSWSEKSPVPPATSRGGRGQIGARRLHDIPRQRRLDRDQPRRLSEARHQPAEGPDRGGAGGRRAERAHRASVVAASTVKEVVAYAKANQGKLNFASPAAGAWIGWRWSSFATSRTSIWCMCPTKAAPAPRGGADGRRDESHVRHCRLGDAGIKSGRVRPLAVTSTKRIESLPDVPTVTEAGYPALVAGHGRGFRAGRHAA